MSEEQPEKFADTKPGAIVWTPADEIDETEYEPIRPVEPSPTLRRVAEKLGLDLEPKKDGG